MVTWSVTTLLLAIASSATGFYVLRFLLGAAEAGLYPAQIFFLTLWFPQRERARATGVLTLGSALGNGLSALICGVLLDLNGVFGLAGWQWIFVATGIAPLFATVLVLRYLPNRPSEAPFYDDAEKARVEAMLAEDPETSREQGHSLGAILNWRVVGFGLLYAILLGSLYGVVYWAPTVYSEFKLSGKMNGLLVAIPWAFDVILLLLIPRRLKTYRATLLGLLVLGTLGVLSYGIGALGGGVWIKLASLMVGIPAISLAISCFWTLPVRFFSGGRAAAAIGAISTIGNLGGVATLNAMPAVAKWGGSPATALLVPSIGMVVVIVAAVAMLLKTKRSS
jgi:MFS family permease